MDITKISAGFIKSTSKIQKPANCQDFFELDGSDRTQALELSVRIKINCASPAQPSLPGGYLPFPFPLDNLGKRVSIPLNVLGVNRMKKSEPELLQGTLDMLILKTLVVGPMHGYAIVRKIQEVSEDVLKVEEGSLYPALHRMERRGWISSEWGTSENNRQARFYRLSRAGRKQLESEANNWSRLSKAIIRVMKIA